MAYRSSRVRWLGAAMLLLVGGAIVNVLVAWGCVIAAPPLLRRTSVWGLEAIEAPMLPRRRHPGEVVRDRMARTGLWWGMTESRVIEFTATERADGLSMQGYVVEGSIWLVGWPCRSLNCAATNGGTAPRGGFWVPGLTSGAPGDPPRPFPCIPMWPGFALNTALYTAVLASGFVGFRWWRSRRLHGRCKGCGYDLAGNVSGVCPECGERT